MLYLVELDHVKSGTTLGPDAGRTFIEQIVLPSLGRAEQLAAEGTILSGGAVAGRIALRFILEVASSEQADRLVTSLRLWPFAETRVTPLITFAQRREHAKSLMESLGSRVQAPAL